MSLANEKSPEVLVIGAGPVGLFTALALTRRGVAVQVVDTGVWPCTHSYALALHPQSLCRLREMGLQDRVMETAYPVRTIGLYDASQRRAQIQVANDGDPSSALAVTRQDALEYLLENALREQGVKVCWRHELSHLDPGTTSVVSTIDKYEKESRGYIVARTEWVVAGSQTLRTPFVVGADGYNSQVRRAMHVDFPEVQPPQYYAVFEFKSNADLKNEMRIVLGDGTTDVLWPLPEGYCRWSFELAGYGDRAADRQPEEGPRAVPVKRMKDRRLVADEESPALEEKSLRSFIHERAPWFTGSIDELTWRTVVRFERRLASAFGQGRMWLAGDSAHLTGPVGVQSMNVGLAEGYDLAAVLGETLHSDRSADELKKYGDRWTAEWRRLLGLDGDLIASAETDPWIREHAHQLVACLPAHGSEMKRLISQLGLST